MREEFKCPILHFLPLPPKSLCILRLSAVGDVCHALAVVQHIQRHWPQTKLTWIVGKTEMGLLSGMKAWNWFLTIKERLERRVEFMDVFEKQSI